MIQDEKYDNYNPEYNPIEDMIEILNSCRSQYYKLYKKGYKVASIRLRQDLQEIIQIAKNEKRNALLYRKEIEQRHIDAKEEARLENEKYDKIIKK